MSASSAARAASSAPAHEAGCVHRSGRSTPGAAAHAGCSRRALVGSFFASRAFCCGCSCSAVCLRRSSATSATHTIEHRRTRPSPRPSLHSAGRICSTTKFLHISRNSYVFFSSPRECVSSLKPQHRRLAPLDVSYVAFAGDSGAPYRRSVGPIAAACTLGRPRPGRGRPAPTGAAVPARCRFICGCPV
jgi:hypothetical protein